MTEYESREDRLPKWAQEKMFNLRRELSLEKSRRKDADKVAGFVGEHEWHSILGPRTGELKLFILLKNHAQQVASILRGDMVFVGRKKRKK